MTGIVIHSTPLRAVAFVCPHCGVDRDGALVERRSWFALGGRRLVPLGRLTPMVRCDACRQECGIAVLNIPTASALQRILEQALRHAIVAVVRAGRGLGPGNDEVDRHAVSIVRNAGFAYDRFALAEDLASLHESGTAPQLRLLADELTLHGKQALLHRLLVLATIDGPLRPAQRETLLRIGIALGMSAAHINGIIAVGEHAAPER